MNRSRIQWICGAIAAFLTVAASADPPMYKFNNRSYGNSVDGGACSYFDYGERCRAIQVWENYDVKGTFEYTEASLTVWRYEYDPVEERVEEVYRYISCPVGQDSIAAHPNRVTISVALDTEDPGCYQYGYVYTWDPINGSQWSPSYFTPGIRIIEGEWMEPFSYGSSMWNQKDKFYDGWSGTTGNGVHHCKANWGDYMTRGGFTMTSPTGVTRSYEFDGPNAPTWSFYYVSSCNDNEIQK